MRFLFQQMGQRGRHHWGRHHWISRPRRAFLVGALLLGMTLSPACSCGKSEPLPVADAAGVVIVRPVTGGVELVLSELQAPLRTFQVDVTTSGGRATAVFPSGAVEHDVIGAGVDKADGNFRVVVADTRRLLLTSGGIARLDLEPGTSVSLANAKAVNDSGNRVVLEARNQ